MESPVVCEASVCTGYTAEAWRTCGGVAGGRHQSEKGPSIALLYGRARADFPHVHPDVTRGSCPCDQLQSPPGFSFASVLFHTLANTVFFFLRRRLQTIALSLSHRCRF